jgi:hypothetical protein
MNPGKYFGRCHTGLGLDDGDHHHHCGRGTSLSPADFRDGTVFQIGQPPGRIDLLQHIDGVSFEEAWENRMEGLWDGEIRTAVMSKDDLIRNKLASGREQDVLDVKKLRARG